MLSIPDAEEVLPRRRNHGLKPSDEPALMMRRCYGECQCVRRLRSATDLGEVRDREPDTEEGGEHVGGVVVVLPASALDDIASA